MPSSCSITELEAFADRFAGAVDGFDVSCCSGADAARVFRLLDRLARVVDAGKALAATRVDETKHWRKTEARSVKDWMVQETGGSGVRNDELLKRGKAMVDMPEIGDAAKAGRVAPEAVDNMARVLPSDRGAASKLLDSAVSGADLHTLKAAATEALARAEDDQARARRLHKGRRVRRWFDGDGFWRWDVAAAPHVGAQLEELLQPWIDAIYRQNRAANSAQAENNAEVKKGAANPAAVSLSAAGVTSDEDTPENRAFDGLLAMALAAANGGRDDDGSDVRPARLKKLGRAGSDTKVIVHVDHTALRRGHVVDGETCEVAGYGPIPVSVAEELLGSGDVFVAAVLTDGTDVFNVVHLGRKPTAIQKTALQWKYRECAHPTCHRIARLDDDHINAWALSKRTDVKDLQRLCPYHHRQKTRNDCIAIAKQRLADTLAEDDAAAQDWDQHLALGLGPDHAYADAAARPETRAASSASAGVESTAGVGVGADQLGLGFDSSARGDPGRPSD